MIYLLASSHLCVHSKKTDRCIIFDASPIIYALINQQKALINMHFGFVEGATYLPMYLSTLPIAPLPFLKQKAVQHQNTHIYTQRQTQTQEQHRKGYRAIPPPPLVVPYPTLVVVVVSYPTAFLHGPPPPLCPSLPSSSSSSNNVSSRIRRHAPPSTRSTAK